MPDAEANAEVIKARLASFARVPADKHSPLTCPRCGKTVDTDSQVCQFCGASCASPPDGNIRVATAAPELTANRKVYDPYEHIPPYAVPAVDNTRVEAEEAAEYSGPAQDAGDEEEEDEIEADRRNYKRAVILGLLIGVLGLAVMAIWHWRGDIREFSSRLNHELSSELGSLKGGTKATQPSQPSVVAQAALHKHAGAAKPRAEHSAAQPASVAAPEVAGSESSTLALASNSGSSSGGFRPALTPASISPMRISIAPRESLQLLVYSVPPVYPQNARERRIEGSVALKAVIGRDGAIAELRAVSGDPQLVPAAMDAVRQWRYRPYFLNSEAREVETTILVDFSLAKNERQ